MKKILFFSVMLAFAGMIVGCSSCNKKNPELSASDTDGVIPEITASVDNIIATSRQRMHVLANGGDYRYFETTIKMADYLDSEDQNGQVEEVMSVFQIVIGDTLCFDTQVWMIGVDAEGPKEILHDNAFYVGNCPLNDEPLPIDFDKAITRLNQANIVKPHSRYVVLRKPVGSNDCNPQWIFGNSRYAVFVDAVTGNVRTDNPAFEGYVGGPLGEWP